MSDNLKSTQMLNRFIRMAVSSPEFQEWLTQVHEDKTALGIMLGDAPAGGQPDNEGPRLGFATREDRLAMRHSIERPEDLKYE